MRKTFTVLLGVVMVVALLTSCSNSLFSSEQQNKYTVDEAQVNLEKIVKQIKNVNYITPQLASLDVESFTAIDISLLLPDFELTKTPVATEPRGSQYITVFSSTEKATDNDTDRWLIDMAEEYNNSNRNGYGVRLYGVNTGEAYDYIRSGKKIPDLYLPANELFGDALGLKPDLERLVGNVAGIVTPKDTPKTLHELVDSVRNEGFRFGFTNPNSSGTGYNFLKSYLAEFGEDTFEAFQQKIPFVAYSTGQMRDASMRGVLDGFVYEAQVFESGNTSMHKTLRENFVFTPFGVRHDNPAYILNDNTRHISEDFLNFCLTEDAQRKATDYGFNRYDDYQGLQLSGSTMEDDRLLYKEKKSGGQEIVSVFVCDVSGSMNGTPLTQLKAGLLEGIKHIGENNSIGMITYSTNVDVVVPIAKFDAEQRAMMMYAVENLYADGATMSNSAITIAMKMLVDYQNENPNARVNVYLLTDGDTTASDIRLGAVQDVWQSLQIPIYAIGYNGGSSDLDTIAGLTEAARVDVTEHNVLYVIANFFRSQM